jgi:hypothetical protein
MGFYLLIIFGLRNGTGDPTPTLTPTATQTATVTPTPSNTPIPTKTIEQLAHAFPSTYLGYISERKFDLAWDMLTERFKDRTGNKEDYIDYFSTTTWELDDQIYPITSVEGNTAIVVVRLTITPYQGTSKTHDVAKFCLRYEYSRGWLLDNFITSSKDCT